MKQQKYGGVMFKKTVFTIIGILVAGIAFASVNVYKDGQNYGPAQDINFVGATITDNGPAKTVSVNDMPTLAVGSADQFTVSATGIIVDSTLYATTQGAGGNRTVCVSADGKIFSSAAACP